MDVYEEEFRQHIVDGHCKTGTCPISPPSDRKGLLGRIAEIAAD
jgi:hypothetical protein